MYSFLPDGGKAIGSTSTGRKSFQGACVCIHIAYVYMYILII